ncbi:hypothetical protein [Glycomyces harbinensis]|uniref:Poly(3-hydroxybutyrate) depolymerase n=1 Tax=Glycomyces harbinensis TaxID=58114 RepID=A0A1G6XJP0_9ACTN|nr:hypothetical protein [Glycomyces harbinensis]SDD78409.1 Poly(3-hydroxybutyrate) depolymerase [Glycomyces harbinensis]
MHQFDRRRLLWGTAAAVGAAALPQPASAAPHRDDRHPTRHDLSDARPLDVRPPPEFDYTRANRLPAEMTGFWEKTFDVGGTERAAKVYLSAETPIRSYYTVIALPEGADAADFLHRTGWKDVADRREEGLVLLEPGENGWGDRGGEAEYVAAAMDFYQANDYFSIFGLHYLVGYGAGAPPLEAWAVAHPLRVIAQVYLDSPGLDAEYLDAHAALEFDGTTAPDYTDVVLPEDLDRIRYDETVLPTWYLHPGRTSQESRSYWNRANDTKDRGVSDRDLGTVYRQRRRSDRWMTAYAGPISMVAVDDRRAHYWSRRTTTRIAGFLTRYTRYENSFAYGNSLIERADYDRLDVEVRTMEVEGFVREYLVHVPETAERWSGRAPVVFVWPGNTQTDKVFFEAAQWWKVAEREGCILVVVCEQYSASPISVSHRDSLAFYQQLRDMVIEEYPADPTRLYSTGQSAGSAVTQNFAMAFPEYFAAVASTSFTTAPDDSGNVTIDGTAYPASGQMIPNYQVYGYGDLRFMAGDLWDDTPNRLDDWALHHLGVNGLALADVDERDGVLSGRHDRYRTWTWHGGPHPVLKLTLNRFRSHNNIPEESPLMWDFLEHYSLETAADGTVSRYYSASGFHRDDKVPLGG